MTPGVDFIAEVERAIRELFPKPKMLIIGFPSNPTAKCVELDFFERIVALAREHDMMVVHDLAYADIVYDGYQAPSIMQVPGARGVAVEFFTMSKSYNMAGWRIGFMVGNQDLVHALARIKSYHDYGSFTPIQVASIVALEGPQQCVADIRRNYEKRRDVMVKGLHDIGWMVENPKASMYVWAKIPETYAKMGSLEFTKRLMDQAKIAVSPGIGFMVGNKDLVNALARIKSYHDYGTFTPIQVASIVALEGPQQCVEEIRANYQRRRDVMVKGLHDIGWMVENPRASMYVWAKIPEYYAAMGSIEFTKRLMDQAKIAVSPGIGFGDYGDDHVRIALIENENRLRQALRGIREMFRKDGLLRGAA